MSDLISRQKAIDELTKVFNDCVPDAFEELDIAITTVKELPSAENEEFEWCHDCKEYDQEKHCCHRWTKVIRETVDELKSAEPERKTGEWINHENYDECSKCHCFTYVGFNFCPQCGADMRSNR